MGYLPDGVLCTIGLASGLEALRLRGFTPTKRQPLPGEKIMWRGWSIFSNLCDGYKLAFQKNYETG